jgi:hypothetical protein
MKTKLFLARRVLRGAMGCFFARPQLLRMASRMTRNHAGANASRHHVHCGQARRVIAAQHSVHPTGGSLRVFKHFAQLQVNSAKMALSHPTHQRVTQAVGWLYFKSKVVEARR